MGIGISTLLLAVGAVLLWGVTATVAGVNINVIGVILMIAGAIGLIVGLAASMGRDRGTVERP
jgi:hypothetical protein